MVDDTSDSRRPPPPPPPKRPPPPPPPKRQPPPPPPPPPKSESIDPLPPSESQRNGCVSRADKKTRTLIVIVTSTIVLVGAGSLYLNYTQNAEAERLAQERIKQEEDAKKRDADKAAAAEAEKAALVAAEAEKAAKAMADLKEQVATVLHQSGIPIDTATRYLKLMLDGSAVNNEKIITSAQHEIEALPKPPKGDTSTAQKLFDEVRKLSSNGNYADAVPLAIKAVAADSSDPIVMVALGITLRKIGKIEDAEQAFLSALTLAPTESVLWRQYGVQKAIEGKADAAVAALLNSVRYSSNRQESIEFLKGAVENEQEPRLKEAAAATLKSPFLASFLNGAMPSLVKKAEKAELQAAATPQTSHPQKMDEAPQQSWRIPGRITAAISVKQGSTPCQQSEIQKPERRNAHPKEGEVYCIAAESVQAAPDGGRVRHTWASDYPYVPGTTLWMKVFEDGRIVIE